MLTVEIAFGSTMFDGSPSWTDVSAYVREPFTSTRGRSSVGGRFGSGTAALVLHNRDGRFTPDNTAGAYYPNVVVGVPVRITKTIGMTTYPVFYGEARAWPPDYPRGGGDTVTVPLADGFYTLNLEDLSGAEFDAQATDVRLDAVLDHVGWPVALRDFSTPLGSVQATSFALPNDGGEQPALQHLLDAVEAEAGTLFMSAAGEVVFRNRIQHSEATPTVSWVSGDIHQLYTAYDDDYLWNVIQVAREDGAQVVYDSSAGSPKRTLTKDVMPMANDAQVLNVAEWWSLLFGTQRLRIEELTLKPLKETGLLDEVLGLELRDLVNVTHTPQDGDVIDQDCAVEMIRHAVYREDWTTTFSVVPLATVESQGYWILGTSELGTSTRLA
jgi:hypothetical protein